MTIPARALCGRAFKLRDLAAISGIVLLYSFAPCTLRADESADPVVDVHGFVSQGFLLSSKNNYLADSRDGSAQFSEVGFNVTKTLIDDVRIGLQLFARDLGPLGNYQPQFDWYYLDYRFRDWLGVRAGRTKIPFGLYNEINDIDAARVPILLPQSVYPTDHQEYLLAQTGGELYGNVQLGRAGSLEYRAYGGTLELDRSQSPNPAVTVTKVSVPYVFGGRLLWMTPIDGLVLGGSFQAVHFDADYQFSPQFVQLIQARPEGPKDFDGKLSMKFPVKFWVTSIEYAGFRDLLLTAEYSHWIADIETDVPSVLPNSHTVNERYYLMGSYRVTPWFVPGLYYSGLFEDIHKRQGRAAYQHDVAATLRFDLTAHWLLKLEGHMMRGTAALDPNLNSGIERNQLTRNWVMFLAKTTGYF